MPGSSLSRLSDRLAMLLMTGAAAASVALASAAYGQESREFLVNGDFEATGLAEQSAWRLIAGGADSGPDAAAYESRTSFRLTRDASTMGAFAAIGQAIDATPLRGQTVRFRAAARVAGRGDGASGGLWLRVDREDGGRGFFDNMSARPIRRGDWAVYEIEGPVAEDATRITVGFLLNGVGSGWIDAATLEIVPTPALSEWDRAPLTARRRDNLVAFAKVYGYVRWFSPYSEPNHPDWDRLGGEGAIAAEAAEGPEALAALLEALFEPWAPGLAVSRNAVAYDPPRGEAADLVRWRHEGVGFAVPHYKSERVEAARPEVWRADLGDGLIVTLPLTGSLSARRVDERSAEVSGRLAPELRSTRLAATVIAWNVFRHFYPYFEDDGAAWDASLGSWLEDAAIAPDAETFGMVLRRMVAALDDGHGEVSPVTEGFTLPLFWRWVEGKLVVTSVTPGTASVGPGDVVLAIDGRPAESLLDEAGALVSASTPAHRRWKASEVMARRPSVRPASLRLQGTDGLEREVQVTPVPVASVEGQLQEARPAAVTWLPQGAWYFDLTRLDERRLADALDFVSARQPVILDLRGYPNGVAAGFLGHLSDRPVRTPPFLVPVAHLPEARDRDWKEQGWEVRPVLPRLRGPVAFLTDERAMSYSETLLAMVRGHGLADIVGAPTAGMNGNINPFAVPGGYQIRWTGMKVLNHDGADLAGSGVLPTVPVSPTLRGIRQGRDEVLERAIELVTRPPED